MRIVIIAAVALLLVAASLLGGFALRQREPVFAEAAALCSGPRHAAQRVLVIGDSWAGNANVDAAMAQSARVCSLSYPGLTTADILQSFTADERIRTAVRVDLGAVTDAVVLAGVNDALQHRGADAYATGVKQLAGHLGGIAPRVFVVELPATRPAPGMLPMELEFVNTLFACLNDWCAADVTAPYRAAATKLPLVWIDYDALDPALASYEPDGIHLTPAGYAALGRVVATAVIGPR